MFNLIVYKEADNRYNIQSCQSDILRIEIRPNILKDNDNLGYLILLSQKSI